MKTFIAAAIALSAASVQAGAFDYERQIGTAELFPTLVGESVTAHGTGGAGSPVFAHERDIGAAALYPTLISEQVEYNLAAGSGDGEPFSYWVNVWHTDVEIGG